MKKAFEDLAIDFWCHEGKLGHTEPSLCLFHGVELDGAQLLDALIELMGEASPCQRVIIFAPCSRKSALCKLTLRLVSTRDELKVLSIRQDGAAAMIEMTVEGWALVEDAVTRWLAGKEDFGVSSDASGRKAKQLGILDRESGELWFWGPGYNGP